MVQLKQAVLRLITFAPYAEIEIVRHANPLPKLMPGRTALI